MLGDILEKPVSKVANLVIGTTTGFPLSRKVARRPVLPQHNSTPPPPPQQQPQTLLSNPTTEGRINVREEDENDILIRSMSEKERMEALEEIKSLISLKNLAFLQSMPKQSIDEADAPVSMRKEKASANKLSTGPPSPPKLAAEPPAAVPSSSGESGAILDIFNIDSKVGTAPVLLGQNQALQKERFDLDGRRIVDFTSAPAALKESLVSAGTLTAAQVEAICAVCVAAARTVCSGVDGFALPLDQARDSAARQPQDELRHHQYDGEVPGYNVTEMSEMFRSQYSSQRVVAMRMLCGVLLRRDCVVALEAYSATFDTSDLTGPTEVFGVLGPVYEAALAEVRNVMSGSDEAQARRVVMNAFLKLLCGSDLPVDLPTLLLWALGTGAMKPAAGFAVQGQDQDEGAIAPSFGGSGVSLHNPLAAKLALLRCVSLYLRSPAEELAATLLRDNSLLWPSNGCPQLATPHARRPHVPYEQYMIECAARATQLLDEEDEEESGDAEDGAQDKKVAPESVLEAFALQCRWGRIDALCSRSGLVGQLFGHALSAVDVLAGAEAGSHLANREPSVQIPATSEALLVLGREALDLLVSVVRQGGAETLRQVSKQLARGPCWQLLTSFLSASVGGAVAGHAGRLRSEVRCLCWRLLSEVAMRDRGAAMRLWASAESLPSLALRVILPVVSFAGVGAEGSLQCKETALALALLRTSLCYGLGVSAVTELLLALKLQGCGTLRLGDPIAADVLLLLEQAAVTCAESLQRKVIPRGQDEEVMQAASAVLSFARQHLPAFEEALVGAVPAEVRTSGAVLGFLCAVLGDGAPLAQLEATAGSLEEFSAQNLSSDVLRATQLRGPGLLDVLAGAGAELFAVQPADQQTVSFDAATVHVHGQCADLLQQCVTMYLFSSSALQSLASAFACAGGVGSNVLSVICVERKVLLQRFISTASSIRGLVDDEGAAEAAAFSRWGQGAGSVAAGLLQWQLVRLSQASVLVQLSFYSGMAVRSGDSTYLNMVRSVLGQLGNGLSWTPFFTPLLAAVVRSYVRHMLVAGVAAVDSAEGGVGAVVKHSTAQRYALLVQEHADLASLVGDIALAGFSGVYCGAGLLTETSLCDWMTREQDRGAQAALLPALRQNWAFEVLGHASMRGPALLTWLAVLHRIYCNPDPSQDGMISAALLAERVLSLLKISTADQAAKWLDPGSSDGESVDGATVDAFRSLLFALMRGAAQAGPDEFCRAFCEVTAKEYSEGAGMMTALRRRAAARARAEGRRSLPRRVDLDGALDVCEKVVDAASNQAVDSGVHSAALLVMAGPLMPWAVRQRVWAQLGELGLAHLLEDPDGVQQLLSVLLDRERRGAGLREAAALYCDVASALVRLRAPSDRHFRIVAVTVRQIAQFIFGNGTDTTGTDGSVVVRGPAAHVLTHLQQLLCDDGDHAHWLVQSVLDTAAALRDGQGYKSPCPSMVADEVPVQERAGDLGVTVPPVLREVLVALPASSSGTGQVVQLANLFN